MAHFSGKELIAYAVGECSDGLRRRIELAIVRDRELAAQLELMKRVARTPVRCQIQHVVRDPLSSRAATILLWVASLAAGMLMPLVAIVSDGSGIETSKNGRNSIAAMASRPSPLSGNELNTTLPPSSGPAIEEVAESRPKGSLRPEPADKSTSQPEPNDLDSSRDEALIAEEWERQDALLLDFVENHRTTKAAKYYCEYYYNGLEWFLVDANTPKGCSCPPIPSTLKGDSGEFIRIEPVPEYLGESASKNVHAQDTKLVSILKSVSKVSLAQ